MSGVNLAQIIDRTAEVEHLYWNAAIPDGVDAEQLSFNQRGFGRDRRLAGIGDVIFNNQFYVEPIDPSMEAEEPSEIGVLDRNISNALTPFMLNYLPDLTIPVNGGRIMAQRDGQERPISPTEHFARQVSRLYRKNMFEASLRSNGQDNFIVTHQVSKDMTINPIPEINRLFPIFSVLITATVAAKIAKAGIDPARELPSLVELVVENNCFAYLLTSMSRFTSVYYVEAPIRDYKWSLFNQFGVKIDRFVASVAATHLSKPLLTVK